MNSNETKHTPTPWDLGKNGDKCAKNHAICSGPHVIAKVYGEGYPAGEGWSPQSEANAAFIVEACNEHDRLVTAYNELGATLVNLGRMKRDRDALLATLTELVHSPNAKQNAAWDRARAAIAQAESDS